MSQRVLVVGPARSGTTQIMRALASPDGESETIEMSFGHKIFHDALETVREVEREPRFARYLADRDASFNHLFWSPVFALASSVEGSTVVKDPALAKHLGIIVETRPQDVVIVTTFRDPRHCCLSYIRTLVRQQWALPDAVDRAVTEVWPAVLEVVEVLRRFGWERASVSGVVDAEKRWCHIAYEDWQRDIDAIGAMLGDHLAQEVTLAGLSPPSRDVVPLAFRGAESSGEVSLVDFEVSEASRYYELAKGLVEEVAWRFSQVAADAGYDT